MHKFGFGAKTLLDMPGEPTGDLKEWLTPFPEIDLADMGFGQGITGSPIQLAQGMGVFANGGTLVPLRLLRARKDPGCAQELDCDPSQPTTVFSQATAGTMQNFMIGVIEEGTAQPAKSAWIAAGKTGTAQKINPAGGYCSNKFFSTFAGYGPIPNPKYVIVIILDEPGGLNYYGGSACGPIFQQLFTALMVRDGIPPQRDPDAAPATSHAAQVVHTTYIPNNDPAATNGGDKGYVLTPNPFDSQG
jgi:cell division protein FtsI/penicillin-binding protein 2